MTSVTLSATGRAPAEVVWRRYADTRLWSTWSPQIRRVELDTNGDSDTDGDRDGDSDGHELRTSLTGRVVGLLGVSVRFKVDAVDVTAMTWAWRVHAGPITLRLHHAVLATTDGSRTTLTIEGLAPVVLGYSPVAQLALHQLVRP